jgi:hypothetical protein
MTDDQNGSEGTDDATRGMYGRSRRLIGRHRRSGALAIVVAAAAVVLAAFSGTGSSHAAGLGKRSGSGNDVGTSKTDGRAAGSATIPARE